MEKDQRDKIKQIIFILIFFLAILIVAIIIFLNLIGEDDIINNNTDENYIISSSDTDDEEIEDEDENSVINETTESTAEETNTNYVLQTEDRLSSYFFAKSCLETYLNSETAKVRKNIIDESASNYSDTSVFNWVDTYNEEIEFSIDDIYAQTLISKMNIYIIYYRYSEGESVNQSVLAIRADLTNKTYSIYPYEYLEANNYTSVTAGDKIEIKNIESIEANDNNTYDLTNLSLTAETCVKELFEKYKFDLKFDVDHLYETLDDEYKEAKFPTLTKFTEYIEQNRKELEADELSQYDSNKYTSYVQFKGVGISERYYIFRTSSNLMEYTVLLDNYTIVLSTTYEGSLPAPKAEYCIQRVMSAINDKDYSFIYEHLNNNQKNNEYNTEDILAEFISSNFYEKNDYEIDSEYLIEDTDTYQFTVYIANAENSNNEILEFTMTIILKDETDFEISIAKN